MASLNSNTFQYRFVLSLFLVSFCETSYGS